VHRLIPLLLLVGCTDPAVVTGFRNPQTPIYSSAVLTADRMVGQWAQVADLAVTEGCRRGDVAIAARDGRLQIDGRLCLAGQAVVVARPMVPTGPGRFAVSGMPDPWWVLWVDTDARTLLIGTPSGRFGFILNRGGALPADRLVAAREILDFNGYDVSRLRMFP